MILRGDVFYADLSPTQGSEQGGVRPVIVVQNEMGNRYSKTLQIVPLTTKVKRPLPTHVFLPSGSVDNLEPSVVLAEQLRTIDRSRLIHYVGHIDNGYMSLINGALLVSLGFVNAHSK